MSALCPLHDEEQPRQADASSTLCAWHVSGIRLDLERIAELWPDLTAALTSGGGSGDRVTGTPEKRLPINDTVSEARRQIAHDVHFLTRVMLDESDFAPRRDEGTITGLARWLSRHHDWLAKHEDAAAFAETLSDDVKAARSAAYPSGRRSFAVHPCPDCEGVISAFLRADSDLLPATLRCDTDPSHTWTSDEWMTLGRRIKRQEETA